MQYKDSRQEVTGLTVNRKVNVPATYRNRLRAMIHSLFNTGEFDFVYKKLDETGALSVTKSKGDKRQLLGMLSYIDQVDLFNRRLRVENNIDPDDTEGRITLFRRFLYFDYFYAIGEPVIVCEGKTDNIYLKCAIMNLAATFPKLVTPGTPSKLKVRFFKYSDRRTAKITGLCGGVGGICKLLKNYHADVSTRFKAPPPKHPVIVLIDNDNGAHSIYEAIAGITKKPRPEGHADFIHVTHNLYVVPTPLAPKKAKTCIEDFFDTKTLAMPLNGKTFNREKDADNSSEYGKARFALNVVAKNAETIDFSKFKPILNRLVKVIDDYNGRFAAAPK